MPRYISVLRGINVSGHNLIGMQVLRECYTSLGFKNVKTYIQSGNVVFQYRQIKPILLEEKIQQTILNQFGFEVPVIILSVDALQHIIKHNPFIDQVAGHLYITLLQRKPAIENMQSIQPEKFLPDTFFISDKAVYIYCPNGYGRTKINNTFFEKKLKVMATTRNWKTINKLLEMAMDLEK